MAGTDREWRAESLGPARELALPQGPLRYHSVGSGPTVVFVHGVLVNANLWRNVVAALSADFRCVTLDLPFGSHVAPLPPDADLSPPAAAVLIADAIEALELDDVTLVGNDSGGAISQIVATRRPERIGALVLTSCDAFDNFPPKALRPLKPLLSRAALLRPLPRPRARAPSSARCSRPGPGTQSSLPRSRPTAGRRSPARACGATSRSRRGHGLEPHARGGREAARL